MCAVFAEFVNEVRKLALSLPCENHTFRVCVEDWGCFQLLEAAKLRIMDLSRLQAEFAVLCPK